MCGDASTAGGVVAAPVAAAARSTLEEEHAVGRHHIPQRVAWDTVAHLTVVLAAYAAVVCAALNGRVGLLPACAPAGFLQLHLFYALHEAVHGNIVPAYPAVNAALGRLVARLMMFQFDAWKGIHMAHHVHVNDEQNDPDMWIGGPIETRPIGWFFVIVVMRLVSAVPVLGLRVVYALLANARGKEWVASGDRLRPHRDALFAGHQLCVAICIVLALMGFGWEALLLWYVPCTISGHAQVVVSGWLPHHPHHGNGRYDNSRVALFGSRRVNAVVTLLVFAGHNYHPVHHMLPHVPTLRLRAVFEELRQGLEANGLRVEGTSGSGAAPLRFATPVPRPLRGPCSAGFDDRRRGE